MLRRVAYWALTWTDEIVLRTGRFLAWVDRRWYQLYMDWSYRLQPHSPDPPP